MRLKWTLVGKNIRPHSQLRSKLKEKVNKLQAHLENFPEDATHLQVALQRHPKRAWFTVGLNLRLPSNTLHAEKSGEDPVPALDSAVKALLREISGLKSELRHEQNWKPEAPLAAVELARVARLPELSTSGG